MNKKLISIYLLLVAIGLSPLCSTAGAGATASQAGSADPPRLVLVGTVLSISGDSVTLAALNAPRFTKTFRVGTAPVVSVRGNPLGNSAITVGSVLVVEQANGAAGYSTTQVTIAQQK